MLEKHFPESLEEHILFSAYSAQQKLNKKKTTLHFHSTTISFNRRTKPSDQFLLYKILGLLFLIQPYFKD